jgi:capsular polysaccharide export protein
MVEIAVADRGVADALCQSADPDGRLRTVTAEADISLKGTCAPGRLFAFSTGFLSPGVFRIMARAGHRFRLGLPGPGDTVAVWGRRRSARRGLAVAKRFGAGVLTVEDAFVRSLHPGRMGEPPMGLLLDRTGVHFDASAPSDLERLLMTHALDTPGLLSRARSAIARMRAGHLSKYSAVDPDLRPHPRGYVLVVDQVRDDASVAASGGTPARFRTMLAQARADHPGKPILIKSHPETVAGLRPGHYRREDAGEGDEICHARASPWTLIDGAAAIYTLSSQIGFEAILAGRRPVVFGQPFYAGWGLSDDMQPVHRRTRRLTTEQLFAAAMLLYPTWYDPFRSRLTDFESILDMLEAQTRAWREDRPGWNASGIRRWKRAEVRDMFGTGGGVTFRSAKPSNGHRPLVWASKAEAAEPDAVRIEDGFLRSRGLGAALVPPLSLVADDLGIHYDPSRPNRLEALIAKRATLSPGERARAARLHERLIDAGLCKYNLGGAKPDLPPGQRILVPGQVEDDASLRLGAGVVRTSSALLEVVRRERPDGLIVYKPHPDVEAGLRPGLLDPGPLADVVAVGADPIALLGDVHEVWTITSLLGFEALLRGLPVTVLGAPFYAGWGLTRDLGEVPSRRRARPDLTGLVHAALIDYPRYLDPVTRRICPVEVAVDRLDCGAIPPAGMGLRSLSYLQHRFSRHAALWR